MVSKYRTYKEACSSVSLASEMDTLSLSPYNTLLYPYDPLTISPHDHLHKCPSQMTSSEELCKESAIMCSRFDFIHLPLVLLLFLFLFFQSNLLMKIIPSSTLFERPPYGPNRRIVWGQRKVHFYSLCQPSLFPNVLMILLTYNHIILVTFYD